MNPDRYVRIAEDIYIDRWGGPPPKSSPSWAETFMVLFFLGVIGAVLMPVFNHPRETRCGPTCPNNLKQIGLAVAQYSQDHDEKYPLASVDSEITVALENKATYGWGDALQPYLKSTQIYHCPANSARQMENDILSTQHYSTQPTYISYTDYWLNQHLCGQPTEQVEQPRATFLAGDGNNGDDGTTARYTLRALPPAWRDTPTAPIWRHDQAANYLFADGHVKNLPGTVVTEPVFNYEAFSLKGLTIRHF